jgi:branched-chain amino acid transport system substrate-binding protein
MDDDAELVAILGKLLSKVNPHTFARHADKVDVAIGFDNSSVALAVEQVALQKNRIAIAGAVATTAFTGKNCTPNEASWLQDSYALTNTLARSVVGRGGDTWFFITVDYAFGHSLEADAKSAVIASGGKVPGSTRHPSTTRISAHICCRRRRRGRRS